ncbi:MAG: hypothetical protein ACU84H_10225 [Gammaproteobacteria bacterium]
MIKKFAVIVFALFALMSIAVSAEEFSLPLRLDYSLLKNALVSQLYTGSGQTANLWSDRHGCSYLKLSDPKIDGPQGHIRLLNRVQTSLGTGLGGQCLTILEWDGLLETLQKPSINPDRSVLSFPVTQASAYDAQGRHLTIDQLQDLIKRYAEPKLAGLKVDLNQYRGDIERKLVQFLPREKETEIKEILSTLKFSSAAAYDDHIGITFTFTAPVKPAAPKPEAPFTEAERKQWQAAWREWDEFLNKIIEQAASDTQSKELGDTLKEILADSRRAFQAGLTEHDPKNEDPVRVFFIRTWERLAPQLKTIAKQLPEVQGLRYMTFIAATDVLYQLENIGRPFGLEISSDGLRRLARMLIAGQQEQSALSTHPTESIHGSSPAFRAAPYITRL